MREKYHYSDCNIIKRYNERRRKRQRERERERIRGKTIKTDRKPINAIAFR